MSLETLLCDHMKWYEDGNCDLCKAEDMERKALKELEEACRNSYPILSKTHIEIRETTDKYGAAAMKALVKLDEARDLYKNTPQRQQFPHKWEPNSAETPKKDS